MRFPRSIAGWVLVVIYIYVVVSILIQNFNGNGWGEIIAVMAVGFPWVFTTFVISALLNLPDPYYTIIGLAPAIILNSIILYWIGVGIQKLFSKIKSNHRNPNS